jgi:predicted dehydrogenase
MNKIRIGIVGAGNISKAHLDGYMAKAEAEVVAICDINEERAKVRAKEYSIPKIYTDYKEMMKDKDIDAVSVCTWNSTHAKISIEALNNGKNVLCEKPLCISVNEALEIEDAVKRSNKIFQVGFVRRYDVRTKMFKEFVDNGDLGDIYYAKTTCMRRYGNPGGWFADVERSGGGPVIDLGVHFIDLCWYLMGRPKLKSVSANVYNKLGNRKNIKYLSAYKASDFDSDKNTVEDAANALVRFENGASMFVDVSYDVHGIENEELSVKLYGTKGGIVIEPNLHIITEKYNTILNIKPQMDSESFNWLDSFGAEMAAFVDACLNNGTTLSPIESGVEVMKLLCAIYESAAIGKEISL